MQSKKRDEDDRQSKKRDEDDKKTQAREVINKQYFPVGKSINREYVVSVYGVQSQSWSDDELQEKLQKMKEWRQEGRSYAKQSIEARIVNNVRLLDVDVTNMRGLKKAFAEDGSELMAAKIWAACWNPFRAGWDQALEKEFMDMKNLQYKKSDTMTKGCFARLFTDEKKEIVKSINAATEKTHKGKIRMKRTKEEVETLGKHKKRKFGTTQGGFYSLAINDAIGPDEVLEREGYDVAGRLFSKKTTKHLDKKLKRFENEVQDETKRVVGSPQVKKVVGATKYCEKLQEIQAKVSGGTSSLVLLIHLLPFIFILQQKERQKVAYLEAQLKEALAEKQKYESALLKTIKTGDDEEKRAEAAKLVAKFKEKLNKDITKENKSNKHSEKSKTKGRDKKRHVKNNSLDDVPLNLSDEEDEEEQNSPDEEDEMELTEPEEEPPLVIKKHMFSKNICYFDVKFTGDKNFTSVEIWWLWYEFPVQLQKYIKKKRRKGGCGRSQRSKMLSR